jgi:hypothetical protein
MLTAATAAAAVTTVAIVSRQRETRFWKIMGDPFCERQAGFFRSQTRESRHSPTLRRLAGL